MNYKNILEKFWFVMNDIGKEEASLLRCVSTLLLDSIVKSYDYCCLITM